MSSGLLIALLGFLGGLGLFATPADGAGLLAAAEASRAAAEGELAAFRADRITAHAALLARVDRAQARLSAAREAMAEAERALDAARQSATDAVDAAAERQARLDALDARLAEAGNIPARLEHLRRATGPRVEPRPIFDRAGEPVTAPVLTMGPLRFAAGAEPAAVGLLGGAPLRIGGPPLSDDRAAAVRRLAGGAPAATLPIDLSLGLGDAAPLPRWSIWGWLRAGGPFVWPILALGLAALLVALDRLRLTLADRPPPGLAAAVLGAVERGDYDDARARVQPARSGLARLLAAGLADRSPGALEAALAAEDLRLDRGLRLLAVFAGVAPLLGLLGTVSGMIGTFDAIAVHGTGEPRLLSGGIAQALTTTQLGLMVAVPTLLAHAVLARLTERSRARLEAAAARLADTTEGES